MPHRPARCLKSRHRFLAGKNDFRAEGLYKYGGDIIDLRRERMRSFAFIAGAAALTILSAPAFSMCCGNMSGKDGAKMQCGAGMQHADASKAAAPAQSTAKDHSMAGHDGMKHGSSPAAEGKDAAGSGCCCCGGQKS